MHTLRVIADGSWNVIFIDPSNSTLYIKRNMEYEQALELVNYLNGGTGQPIGKPVVVAKTSLF